MNVQVIADPAGRLIWASPALPGACHDSGAAREHAIPATLAAAGVTTFADTAYIGAGATIRAPFRRVRRDSSSHLFTRRELSAGQKGRQHDDLADACSRRASQRRAQELAPPAKDPLKPGPRIAPDQRDSGLDP